MRAIESVRWLRQNDGGYAYEQVTNGKTYCGRKNARASAIVSCSDALDVTYAQGAQVNEYTALYDSFRRRTAHGQMVVDGRVLIYPLGNFESSVSIPPMLLNSMRQAVLHDVLRTAGRAVSAGVRRAVSGAVLLCTGRGIGCLPCKRQHG